MEELVAWGGREYRLLLCVLLGARAMDFLSTWVATPRLRLEANPLARWLGWKRGVVVNVAVCALVAQWPLLTIAFATTSLLVAARNFHSAWLMRTMGELAYQDWMVDRVCESSRLLYLLCLFAQAVFYAGLGLALMLFGDNLLIPSGVGAGMFVYAVAVVFYSLLAYRRIRKYALPGHYPAYPEL